MFLFNSVMRSATWSWLVPRTLPGGWGHGRPHNAGD